MGEYKQGNALADKIDLFGWSGSTGTAKWGIGTSTSYSGYSGDFVDWGQNAISNGGNKVRLWRTLTKEEWHCILKDRPNASFLQGAAYVNGVNGLILLPDGWKQFTGVSFKSGFADKRSETAYGAYQSFTASEWQRIESAGAVFLPASGYRDGTDVRAVGDCGSYWSATPYDEYDAWSPEFQSDKVSLYDASRDTGSAVRLVQDVK